MLLCLGERQDGGDACVTTGEMFHPRVPRALGHPVRDGGVQRRPLVAVVLRRDVDVETQALHEGRVERRLDRRDGEMLPVGAAVDVVEGGAAVEQVGPVPTPRMAQTFSATVPIPSTIATSTT